MRLGKSNHELGEMGHGKLKFYRSRIENTDSVLHLGSSGPSSSRPPEKWFHKYLNELAETVVGVEIDEAAVENARELKFDVRQGDVETFELGEHFDVIIAPDVIEHLRNPGRMFDRVKEHLQPEGTLLLNTPHPFAMIYILAYLKDGSTERVTSSNHTMWFDEPTLSELAERSGFEVVDSENFTWNRDPESAIDRAFLAIRSALVGLGLFEHAFARQKFYTLKKVETDSKQ